MQVSNNGLQPLVEDRMAQVGWGNSVYLKLSIDKFFVIST